MTGGFRCTWSHRCTYTCSYTRRLTEENDDTEQDGHQSSSCEAVWEGQDLGVAGLHVSTAVTSAHAHDQRAGAALNGVVIVWNDYGQEVHAHLAPAETSPPRQDIGSVICGQMQMGEACQRGDVSLCKIILEERTPSLCFLRQTAHNTPTARPLRTTGISGSGVWILIKTNTKHFINNMHYLLQNCIHQRINWNTA